MGHQDTGTQLNELLHWWVRRSQVPNTQRYCKDMSPGLGYPTHWAIALMGHRDSDTQNTELFVALMGHQHSGTQHTELLHWYVTRTQVPSTQSTRTQVPNRELLHWLVTRTEIPHTQSYCTDGSPGLKYKPKRVSRTQLSNIQSHQDSDNQHRELLHWLEQTWAQIRRHEQSQRSPYNNCHVSNQQRAFC